MSQIGTPIAALNLRQESMPHDICRLCQQPRDLLHSHILPAFAVRWLRDTSGTGHIRLGTAPNQRVQDGLKRYWLCKACEDILNRTETTFATRIFHPYSKGVAKRFSYGHWLLHFCTSLSWRVLRFYREETSLDDYPQELLSCIDEAEDAWKKVLLGEKRHAGSFQQHLLPLDAIESSTMPSLPPNINRYLMRALDMDLVRGENTCFVYSKIGRFVIIGFIKLNHPDQWKGTKVSASEGHLEPRDYVIPRQFGEYLTSKARRMAELSTQVSDRQLAKIDQAFTANIDKLPSSDAFKAMENDVRLFGNSAFSRRNAKNGKTKS